MPSQNHVHTYVKFKSRPDYMRCAAPDCTHYTLKETLIGKNSRCALCGAQFILDKETIRLAKPRCLGCRSTKKAKVFQASQALAAQVLGTFELGIQGEKPKDGN